MRDEIKALTNVSMSAPTPNKRIRTCEGQGMLYEFGNGKAKFVAEAFGFDLQMVFDRTAVLQSLRAHDAASARAHPRRAELR